MRRALPWLAVLALGCTAPAGGDGMDGMPDGLPDGMVDGMSDTQTLDMGRDDGDMSSPPDAIPDALSDAIVDGTVDTTVDATLDAIPDAAPPAERCDGVDDDGDGRIDEGLGLGAPCAVGLGRCAAPGVVACVDGAAACVGEPAPPGAETCDGTDEDCDGRVDEDHPSAPCHPGRSDAAERGACRPGRTACVTGVEVCLDAVVPERERCDGRDADCDGRVDEGCALCGDGALDPGEGCDDGNRVDGDGCAADCAPEGGPAALVPGVQRDVPLATLAARGFRPCHADLYAEAGTPLADVLERCRGEHLLIGCQPVGGDVLTVAAEGHFADVTADVGDGRDGLHRHNGVDFYFSGDASWGFAPAGAGVNRNTCDVVDEASPERMCWHTSGDALRGGWRCGSAVRLNDSRGFERLVFTRSHVALGALRGFGHHGDCGAFNGCVDAAGCAAAACTHFGHGPPVAWREGRCAEVPGIDCDLFERAPDALDTDWAPGCDMPAAYDVVCAPGAGR